MGEGVPCPGEGEALPRALCQWRLRVNARKSEGKREDIEDAPVVRRTERGRPKMRSKPLPVGRVREAAALRLEGLNLDVSQGGESLSYGLLSSP